jgi:adenylate kinase family enzyme
MIKKYLNKLIVLRGNSGSGKSTIAKEIREKSGKPNKIALVEQDYLRRIVLKEKEKEGTNNIGLIKAVTEYALTHGYDVILEGIFYSGRYSSMIKRLLNKTPNHYVYYLDVSLEETIKRHSTKSNSHEFGEKELRDWYKEKDVLGVSGEIIVEESSSLQNTVDRILKETGI